MSKETGEAAIWKRVDELIANMQDKNDKLSKFARIFQERADEKAMKIWVQCFNEAYGKQEEEVGIA
jgi:hypothetical protein